MADPRIDPATGTEGGISHDEMRESAVRLAFQEVWRDPDAISATLPTVEKRLPSWARGTTTRAQLREVVTGMIERGLLGSYRHTAYGRAATYYYPTALLIEEFEK